MQPRKATGIIINIQPHRDFDRVLTVFTQEYGKIRVIAKGVRRIKSQRGFHLDLFNHVRMELEESGNGSACRRYLREVSNIPPFLNMEIMPENFAAACVIAYFLDKNLLEHSPQRELFNLTKKTLEALNKSCDIKEVLLSYFLKSMRTLGYLPPALPKGTLRQTFWKIISQLDPTFSLNARRTLGIFSKFDRTRSN